LDRPSALGRVAVAGNAATVTFSSADSDVARYQCRLDQRAFALCVSGQRYSGLAAGAHTIFVRALDTAGNVGGIVSRRFAVAPPATGGGAPPSVDRTPPSVVIAAVSRRASRSGVVRLSVGCPAGETTCAITVRLKRGGRVLARRSITLPGGSSRVLDLRLCRAARRTLAHRRGMKVTVKVAARDAVGNAGTATKALTLVAPKR
jgi:hypothetical protein